MGRPRKIPITEGNKLNPDKDADDESSRGLESEDSPLGSARVTRSRVRSRTKTESVESPKDEESENIDEASSSSAPLSKRMKTDSDMSSKESLAIGSFSSGLSSASDSENPDDPSPSHDKNLNSPDAAENQRNDDEEDEETDDLKGAGSNNFDSSKRKSGQHDNKKSHAIQVKNVKDLSDKVDENEDKQEDEAQEDPENVDDDSLGLDSATSRKLSPVTKEGRKFMILDKATIKGMMEKGLIQAINKDDGGGQNVTYRAILPKTGPSILRKVGKSSAVKLGASEASSSSGIQSSPNKGNTSVASGSSTTTTSSSSSTSENQSSSVKVHVPTSIPSTASGLNQGMSGPIFVKTSASGLGTTPGASQIVTSSGNMQVVPLSTALFSQVQKGGNLLSLAVTTSSSGEKTLVQTVPTPSQKNSFIITSSDKLQNQAKDDPDLINLSDSEEDAEKAKYGVPTGVCKVLKSMKMYQYVDKGEDGGNNRNGPKNSHNIRWVAVPNDPADSVKPDIGPKIQRCTPPILPINVPTVRDSDLTSKVLQPIPTVAVNTSSVNPLESEEIITNRHVNELKMKQKEQLVFHRKRYSDLLVTYNQLASKYDEVKDVGTVRQILTDAKKYMKRDHIMFFRNEMLLRDRSGTGHRYSPRFMTMLIKYYNRSPIGYRFLRQIFTLPAVRTLLNWQNKSLHVKKKAHSTTGEGSVSNDEVNGNNPSAGGSEQDKSTKLSRIQGGISYRFGDCEGSSESDEEDPSTTVAKTAGVKKSDPANGGSVLRPSTPAEEEVKDKCVIQVG